MKESKIKEIASKHQKEMRSTQPFAIVDTIENDIKEAFSIANVMVELPKWKTCKNCDCGEFPVRRCDCSCHD